LNREEKFEESPCFGCPTNCCRKFFIILEDVRDREWTRWLSLHRGVAVRRIGWRKLEVWFDNPCRNLREDGSCAIYVTRPKTCREFICERLGGCGRAR
jgi:Fe-S-cluster containining protein